jgi:exopolyphosphatase / guanosine-5'-triphosphate,3'-diphosphate pyrophosphatase
MDLKKSKTIAIVDIGTTSTKLLISEFLNGQWKSLFKQKYESNFGKDMDQNDNNITEEGISKNVQILSDINKLIDQYNVKTAKIFATEVLRKASNANKVKEILEKTSSLQLKILSHDEESFAFWTGLTNDFDYDGILAAYDVGGGSYQFMYGTKEKLFGTKLVNKGVNYYRDNFTKTDPPTPKNYEDIELDVQNDIQDLDVIFDPIIPLVHGSSSVINLYKEAGYYMETYSQSFSHPYKVSLDETRRMYNKVRCLPYIERQKYFPSMPFFMETTYIGTAIMLKIAEKTGLQYELPSNNNIANGLVYLVNEGRM